MNDPRILCPLDGALPHGIDARRIPLGSVSVVRVAEERCFPALAEHVTTLAPWLPLVALAPDNLVPGLTAFLEAMDQARATQSLVLAHFAPVLPESEVIFRSINSRPAVSSRLLARWLGTRLERPELVDPIEAAMATDGEVGRVAFAHAHRTLQRRLGKALDVHPSDLKRLARVATLERMFPSVGRLAAGAGTTAASLRRIVTPLLRVSLSTYNERPGWEWVLEAACRQGLGAGGWGLGAGGWGLDEDSEL